jgi:peptidoglycan/LPS O-acetylase OafA/YrhL
VQPDASAVPDLLTHLLFIHTWFPQRYGTIDGVLWTLAVEVEFYCLFPLIWWCFRRQPWLTAGIMIAIAWWWRTALALCCYSNLFVPYEENLPGYLDIFAFGMIAAHLFTRFGDAWRVSRARWVAPLLALASIAFLVALLENLYAFRFNDQWSGVWQIDNRPLLGAGFAAIALAFLASPRWWQAVLDNPPLRFMATISYNLYLYHQLIARELLWHHVPRFSSVPAFPHEDSVWQRRYTEATFAITIAQAAIVTYCFERPLLKIRLKDGAG